MKSWNKVERNTFMDNIEYREERGADISCDKKQASILCNFVQEQFMEQYIDSSTRGQNLLDLMFCNDSDLITYNLPIDNVIISDHTLCVLGTNFNITPISRKVRSNIYSTEISNYNLMDATSNEWENLNNHLFNIDWEEVFRDDCIENICDVIIKHIENGVMTYMRPMVCNKPTHKSDGTKFKSKNIIPKFIRTLFKRKSKLSKSYRKVKTVNRCTSLRRKILEIDMQLKNHYESKKLQEEMKLFEKAKSNKNILFNYIKQKQRKNCKIGPFIKDNVIIDREPAEILKDQYESVFSTPKPEFYINDHIKFFKNCVFCEKRNSSFL